MTPPSNSFSRIIAVAGFAAFSASPASAVIPFVFSTDSNAVISGGSWSGNGTVLADAVPGTVNGNFIPPAVIVVDNFSSGVLTIDNFGGNVFTSERLRTGPISSTHSITVNGGTADLRMHNSNSFDDGGSLFNSIGLTGFSAGITSITYTMNFSYPIAGRDSDVTSTTTRPIGAGLAMITAGTNLGLNSFDVGMSFSGAISTPTSNGTFVPGVPSNAIPLQNSGFGTPVAGATSFSSTGFAGFDNFLLVRGYDYNGSGNGYDGADADLAYITGMTWTITPKTNQNFAANTLFVFSMDGQQYLNVFAIPEPTSSLLVAGSLVGACLLRRRRRA